MKTSILAVATLAAATVLTSCGGDSSDSEPKNMNVEGSLLLKSNVGYEEGIDTVMRSVTSSDEAVKGDECEGRGGFDDLKEGSQVEVSDNDGKTLALGELDKGELTEDGNYGNTCRFTFSVKDVPEGEKFYSVKIGHRTGPKFTENKLKDGPALTIGSD